MEKKVYIFPTDTVFGIGCSIYDRESQDRIYEIKKRDRSKPLAVLCANIKQIEEICYLNNSAKKLVNYYLPGPLTIIVNAKENISSITGFKTIGVRIPKSNTALDLLEKYGPFTTTSVNDSGEKPINDYQIIKEKYSKLVDEIIENSVDDLSSNVASTVVDVTSNEPKIVRLGEITLLDIKKIIE